MCVLASLRPVVAPLYAPHPSRNMGHATRSGRLAQLGERRPYKAEVTGSSPVTPTMDPKVTHSHSGADAPRVPDPGGALLRNAKKRFDPYFASLLI